MGKRKDSDAGCDFVTEEDLMTDSPGSSHKKHKKHKKKHKKKSYHDDIESSTTTSTSTKMGGIKLKLKIGSETLGTTSITTMEKIESTDESQDQIIDVLDDDEPAFPVKKKGEDTSDEEKEWLDALERGDLDDSGMVKKSKSPKLLTARQRALLHGNQEELLELPSGYKSVELTEEQVLKKQQRAKKRRQQAHEKREKDKKLTLDRLLKKQESKLKGQKGKGSRKANIPRISYINNQSNVLISVPTGFQFPFTAQVAKPCKAKEKCGVKGCLNDKKYSCSKTGVSLCSLECYKRNMSLQNRAPAVSVT